MSAKRNTWQREAVRSALGTTEGFVSAQALHASMRGTGSSVGLVRSPTWPRRARRMRCSRTARACTAPARPAPTTIT